MYIKQNIHKHRTQNFRRISPFGITPVKKAYTARARWYQYQIFLKVKKGMGRGNKKKNII